MILDKAFVIGDLDKAIEECLPKRYTKENVITKQERLKWKKDNYKNKKEDILVNFFEEANDQEVNVIEVDEIDN